MNPYLSHACIYLLSQTLLENIVSLMLGILLSTHQFPRSPRFHDNRFVLLLHPRLAVVLRDGDHCCYFTDE